MITNWWRGYAVGLCAILMAVLILMPVFARADAYDGPYCYESTSQTSAENPDPNGVRGTCKEIKFGAVVSLDPALQSDYFIGTHEPLTLSCGGVRDCSGTKYSEQLTIYSSSTISIDNNPPGDAPIDAAVFNKSFFLPLLLNQFKQEHLNFSENNFPPIGITIYQQAELNEMEKPDSGSGFAPANMKMDVLQQFGDNYDLQTLSTQEYGKYIWAPQSDLVESQYAALSSIQAPTSTNLGITYIGDYGGIPTVSVADPLDSITDYWEYSEASGTPILSWQKTVYGFDDGTAKTVTPSSNTGTVSPTSSATSTQTVQPSTAAPENIFQKIWDFITSWFR
jgi:hypothetical protein